MSGGVLEYVTVFVLTVFVGLEVVSKVPSILHTPLMSGSNAVHGVILVGSMIVLGGIAHTGAEDALGFVAVLLATINVVGGFTVTDRMLEMFEPAGRGEPTATTDRGVPTRLGDGCHPVSRGTAIDLVYLIAAIAFIVALKGLSSPRLARVGNLVGGAGMLLAIGATFARAGLGHLALIVVAMAVGTAIGVASARMVKMTAMPQMVAAFNGVGGGAAAVVSITELMGTDTRLVATYKVLEVLFGVVVGSVAFSGSALAFAKLQELMTGRPVTYPRQQALNGVLALAALGLSLAILVTSSTGLLWVLLAVSLALGIVFVLPVGGADVPVLISLLNSFTGLAVAASGFTLDNDLLIVAGTLVGASGILLTRMMSRAMGRSLPNILFSAFGSVITATGADGSPARTVRTATPQDVGVLMAYARKVVIIPGYGLAVAQAQHVARELADLLAQRGVEVFYAIHPVAGRMPGHMNVLLAEASVPYEELREMDDANPEMTTADVALVVGANDTVNPAARNQPGSPIYGMPIVNADHASHVVFLKRSMRPGFAGIDNELLYDERTVLLFGDAKDTLLQLVNAVSEA